MGGAPSLIQERDEREGLGTETAPLTRLQIQGKSKQLVNTRV